LLALYLIGRFDWRCSMKPFVYTAAILLPLICVTEGTASIVFDAAADFSISGNPNGVWSYGYSGALGGTYNLLAGSATSLFGNSNFDAWLLPVVQHPFVAINGASTVQQGAGLRLPPGGLGLHPGPNANNEFAIVRWTAPVSGFYDVDAAFTDRDYGAPGGATTDVHVLVNGSSLYDGIINRNGWGLGPTPFSAALSFTAGDTVDFVVGRGSNDTYFADSTGLDATISLSVVPEVSSFAMWVLLITGAGFYQMKKRGHRTSVRLDDESVSRWQRQPYC
jgi:hypothetical protein